MLESAEKNNYQSAEGKLRDHVISCSSLSCAAGMLQHSTQYLANSISTWFAHAYLVMQAVDTTHPSLSVWRVQPLRKAVGGWQIFYTRMTEGWLCHSGMANIYLGRPDHKIILLRSLLRGSLRQGFCLCLCLF